MDKTSNYEQMHLSNSGFKVSHKLLNLYFSFDLSKLKGFQS